MRKVFFVDVGEIDTSEDALRKLIHKISEKYEEETLKYVIWNGAPLEWTFSF